MSFPRMFNSVSLVFAAGVFVVLVGCRTEPLWVDTDMPPAADLSAVADASKPPPKPTDAATGGGGKKDGGGGGGGKVTCTMDSDCVSACPAGSKGCACETTGSGEKRCSPTCTTSADCTASMATCENGFCKGPKPDGGTDKDGGMMNGDGGTKPPKDGGPGDGGMNPPKDGGPVDGGHPEAGMMVG